MNKVSDYVLILAGAYMVLGIQALGGVIRWWSPLVWIIVWTVIEIPVRVVRRHHAKSLARREVKQ